MAIQYQKNYQLLELAKGADWATANKHYRRLVHQWHPDRFVQRPREQVHAQQQFIEITKAFNNLRTFYRENNRLPFESIKQSATEARQPTVQQQVSPKNDAELKMGFLTKRKRSFKTLRSSKLKPLLWAIPVGATVLVGMFVFVIIDRNAKLKTIEAANRVLQNVEPSEYSSDSTKIGQANRRSTLLKQSSDGNLGNKLAKDMFQ